MANEMAGVKSCENINGGVKAVKENESRRSWRRKWLAS
jgi:hypothetical protein